MSNSKLQNFTNPDLINLNKQKAISPISIFGPISKFAILKQFETKIEVNENYQKRSIRNRYSVLAANGILTLSIPLAKGKNKSAIKDVKISYEEDWTRVQIMTLKSAYGSSPYFEHYFGKLENIFNSKHNFLIDMFFHTIEFCQNIIGQLNITPTQHFNKFDNEIIDLRFSEQPLIIDIPKYYQVFEDKHGFISNLSILDAIFNLGPETSIILKNTKIELKKNGN